METIASQHSVFKTPKPCSTAEIKLTGTTVKHSSSSGCDKIKKMIFVRCKFVKKIGRNNRAEGSDLQSAVVAVQRKLT